jgi:L-ascorbate metabolism protein UlaG (beta-lactamase superfamily)
MKPADLYWKPSALGRADPAQVAVKVTWLGTAGFQLEHDGHVLLIDPYLSRCSLPRCITAPLRSDAALVRQLIPKADVVIAGHSHFDHILDVPEIARQTGARVFGSKSAATLCRASGVAEAQVVDAEPSPGAGPFEAEVGPFRLRFFPSAHSRFMLGRVPFSGEIQDCDQVPLRTEAYKCGAVFAVEIRVAGQTILHLGSAELVEAQLPVKEPDLLLLCVAGWTASRDVPERIVKAVDPKAVLLSHWDNFFLPLSRGAVALPATRFEGLATRLGAANRDLKVGTLPFLGEVWL